MKAKYKVLISYAYNDTPLSCGNLIEMAFRRREDVEVYRLGEIDPMDADMCFNTEAKSERPHGKFTVWWDIEACSYRVNGEFGSHIVLAPYTIVPEEYPRDKTYFFPFATDPTQFNYHECEPKYDLMFIGREDVNRTKRIEYLDFVYSTLGYSMFRSNGYPRGEAVSRVLSEGKILLQVSGDAEKGVLETRFFEIGLINVLACDRHENNREDLDWAGVPDYHYIAYDSKEELLEKVQKVAKDDAYRARMKARARDNYLKNHTYDVRVRQLLETVGFLKGDGLDKLHDRRRRWGEWNG